MQVQLIIFFFLEVVCHKIFDLIKAKVFSNSVLILSKYSITKLSPLCAAHRGDKKFLSV